MKEQYFEAEMEIAEFESEDIIVTSPESYIPIPTCDDDPANWWI